MSRNITIDPITRISGFLDISIEMDNNIVTNAKTSGLLYRGFEKMLKGRFPLDAVFYTERICGICSSAHSIASSLALLNALGLSMDINDLYVRDLTHGFDIVQNHIRQFYFFTVPDYVRLPDINPISPQSRDDFRLPEALNTKISKDYIAAVQFSALAHEGLATLGGKAPHNHGIFVAGVTANIDEYKIQKVKSIISKLKQFVNDYALEDISIICDYYRDYFQKGDAYSNFISYGLFNDYNDSEIKYVNSGVIINGIKNQLDVSKIIEGIRYSWYINSQIDTSDGKKNDIEIDLSKEGAYTFVKAPRYNGLAMEGGPLARLKMAAEYSGGDSCMDRNLARVLELKKIIDIMEGLANRLQIKNNNQIVYEIPDKAVGTGLTDTARGALGHFIEIENKVIKNYDIITPSSWNLSPIDNFGIHGPGEKAIIGTKIENPDNAVEPGRIIRSFDPCISCATH